VAKVGEELRQREQSMIRRDFMTLSQILRKGKENEAALKNIVERLAAAILPRSMLRVGTHTE